MQHNKIFIPVIFASFLLVACTGTTDPSKGGLFSYNPAAYEKRLQHRENYLADVEARQESERIRAASLESEVAYKSKRVSQQQQQLTSLRANVARDRERLAQAAANSRNPQYYRLQQRAAIIESQAQSAANEQNVTKRRAYLEQLRREYGSLQRDMEALTEE